MNQKSIYNSKTKSSFSNLIVNFIFFGSIFITFAPFGNKLVFTPPIDASVIVPLLFKFRVGWGSASTRLFITSCGIFYSWANKKLLIVINFCLTIWYQMDLFI